jgi:hypothetical protein
VRFLRFEDPNLSHFGAWGGEGKTRPVCRADGDVEGLKISMKMRGRHDKGVSGEENEFCTASALCSRVNLSALGAMSDFCRCRQITSYIGARDAVYKGCKGCLHSKQAISRR